MAVIRPFRAVRPSPAAAACVAAVPYDVVDTEEARAMAEGNPLSFLRISRAEIELPPDIDPYSPEVYARASSNFARLRQSTLHVEAEPSVYFYRLRDSLADISKARRLLGYEPQLDFHTGLERSIDYYRATAMR